MTLTIKDIWDRTGVDVDSDAYTRQIVIHRFLAKQDSEAFLAEKSMILKGVTHLDVADSIASIMFTDGKHPAITGEDSKFYLITGGVTVENVSSFSSDLGETYQVLVIISQNSSSPNTPVSSEWNKETELRANINRITVEVVGHRKAIKKIFTHLTDTLSEAKVSSVKWWYKSDRGLSSHEVFLDPVKTVLRPEFYPFMQEPPDQYMQRYLKSDQSVLLMAGPPGTGKSTILRHMLSDYNLEAEIIYDEKIMDNDAIFQNFLFGSSDIMIIEDADRILSPREDGDNSLMARFLNVSEGIIKLPNKKMIFTTNITDYRKVDPALIRPGRCFDVLHTRELTFHEAQTAARVAGLEPPTVDREYTLAELWNPEGGGEIRKVGF
jgi:hypothetical protein